MWRIPMNRFLRSRQVHESPPMLAAMLAGLVAAGCRTTPPVIPDGPALKVMTYNVFYERAEPDEGEELIRKEGPDFVFLQEVTDIWYPTFQSLRTDYPYQKVRIEGLGLGNAILSREPMTRVQRLPAEYGWHGGWYVQIHTGLGPVQVLGVHLKPPLTDDSVFTLDALLATGPIHRQEIEQYYRHVDPDLPLIVLGDFNEEASGAAATWLQSRGLKDSLATYDLFTPTWRWAELGLVTLRLDHIYHTSDLKCIDARVHPDGMSDHEPVVAVFQREGLMFSVEHQQQARRFASIGAGG